MNSLSEIRAGTSWRDARRRERDTIMMSALYNGKSYDEIGELLGVKAHSVKVYFNMLRRMCKVTNNVSLLRFFLIEDLIEWNAETQEFKPVEFSDDGNESARAAGVQEHKDIF